MSGASNHPAGTHTFACPQCHCRFSAQSKDKATTIQLLGTHRKSREIVVCAKGRPEMISRGTLPGVFMERVYLTLAKDNLIQTSKQAPSVIRFWSIPGDGQTFCPWGNIVSMIKWIPAPTNEDVYCRMFVLFLEMYTVNAASVETVACRRFHAEGEVILPVFHVHSILFILLYLLYLT